VSIRLPTMSKAALSLACQYWLSEHAPRMPWEPSSPAAEHGNAVHSLAEAILEGRQVKCSAEVEPYRAPLTQAIESLRAEGWHLAAEVPVAYTPATGAARSLKKGGHRAYGDVKPHELAGTADIVGVKPGAIIVADVKTGRGAKAHEATETQQLRALAVAFANIYGADFADVALLHVEPNDYELDRGTLYAWDLAETADALRALAATENPQPKPGPHCTSQWCPIRTVCPATKAAIAAIDARAEAHFPTGSIAEAILVETYEERGEKKSRLVLRDEETAKRARLALKLYDEQAKRLREALHNTLRKGAIEVSPGLFYGYVQNSRETVGDLTPEAVALIREQVGESALTYSSSGDAIERAAMAQQTRRGEGKRKAAEIKAALRQLGVMRRSEFSKPQEFTKQQSNDDEGEAA
jgi:hypothetical protein